MTFWSPFGPLSIGRTLERHRSDAGPAPVDRQGDQRGTNENHPQRRRSPDDNRFSSGLSVDLVYLCSTNSLTGVDAAALHRIRRDSADVRTPGETTASRRKWTRLSDETRVAVIERYEAGETSTALAEAYGVAKSTILGILRANSVVVRRQPLTPEQVSEATRLYNSGLSLSQVAERLRVNQETMRVALLKSGLALRLPTGHDC